MTPRIGGPYKIHYDTLRQDKWITIDKCPYCGGYHEVSHECNCIIGLSIKRREK